MTGFRRPTRLSRPPRGARAAESCIEGLSSSTEITADLKPACRRKVAGTQSLPAAHESLATRVLDPTLSTAERAGGVGGALGNPSSYVGTGVPATDRRAVGQTVRSGFPRPHPPRPPGGSAAIGSPQFRTETLRALGGCSRGGKSWPGAR